MAETEEKLMEKYHTETKKNAIWRGSVTKGYLDWKKKHQKPSSKITSTRPILEDSNLLVVQSDIQKIFSKLENFEYRLKRLENRSFATEKEENMGEISNEHFFRILKTVYNSTEKKFGDFISISILTEKIQDYIPWSIEKIHSELYKLFMNYKIDLQPGKNIEGTPLIQDGKSFVWFKLK